MDTAEYGARLEALATKAGVTVDREGSIDTWMISPALRVLLAVNEALADRVKKLEDRLNQTSEE